MLLEWIGERLARYLAKPNPGEGSMATLPPEVLAATLRKGDILLVEGTSRFGTAIKYLTQSTWSHAALYIGDALGAPDFGDEPLVLIEADVLEGVRAVPLSMYADEHTRICRPVGISEAEISRLIGYAISRLGGKYDLKNIIDLLRYLVPTPPVPSRWRRQLLAIGSGDPTRAICSSLIAQAFAHIHYPILPERLLLRSADPDCPRCYRQYFRIRHHSLYAPRDFDLSPYFQVVKPVLERGFDPHSIQWHEEPMALLPPPVEATSSQAGRLAARPRHWLARLFARRPS